MGFLGSILGAVAGPLVGGLLGSRQQKKQNQINEQNTLLQLPRLKQSAEDAGFNPLTALLATGGQGFNPQMGAAPLASQQTINNMVSDVSDIFTGKAAADKNRQGVIDQLNQIKLDQAQAGGVGGTVLRSSRAPLPSRLPKQITATMPTGNGAPAPVGVQPAEQTPLKVNQVHPNGPRMRPNLFSSGMTPVIGVDGGNKQIPTKLAERLQLAPWDAMIVEDGEALYGDEIGQVVMAPQVPNAVIATEGGVTKQRTADERESLIYRGLGDTDQEIKKEAEKKAKAKEEKRNPKINFPSYLPSITN